MTYKWKGTDIEDLRNGELLEAIRKTIKILNDLWTEVARRRLTFKV